MTKKERDQKIITMLNAGEPFSSIAKRLKISKGTVHNVHKRWQKDDDKSKILNELEQITQQQTKDIIDMVRSTQYHQVAKYALDLLNEQNMNEEVDRNGITTIYRMLGQFIDKTTSVEELDIKRRQIAIREREVAIREKELELRISNPEAFHTVQIINDAPPTSDEYEPRIANQWHSRKASS